MTSEIGAPLPGGVDAAGGLLPDGLVGDTAEVPEDAGVEVWVCGEPPLTGCVHPATSNVRATNAAIRIPSG